MGRDSYHVPAFKCRDVFRIPPGLKNAENYFLTCCSECCKISLGNDHMKEQIKTLAELQRIETEMSRTRSSLDEFPGKIEALNARLIDSEKIITDETDRLARLKKEYRSLESDAQMKNEAVKKSEARLLSLKSNKEYQAVLKEIDEARKKVSQLEDQLLTMLDGIEEAEKSIPLAKTMYENLKSEIESQKEHLGEQESQNTKKFNDLEADRKKVAQKIPQKLLDAITHMKRNISSPVVVPVKKGVCRGCNINIPPQMAIELQRCERLEYCPFCHRIIYWEKADS
jgi:hypothetical protein